MAKAFKFRYVNEIVGTFVIVVLLLLVVGIFLAGHAQQWFVPVYRLTIEFPPEGSFGLKPGAEVIVLGTVVGSLEKITVSEEGMMTGRLAIKGDFIRFVRADSKAIAKKKFVVAGDSFIEITKGEGRKLPEGAVLECVKDTEITEMVQDVVRQIREATIPAIDQARLAMEEYTGLAADFRDPDGNVQRLVGDLKEIVEGIKDGEGAAGKVLRDPEIAEEVKRMVEDISAAVSRFPVIMETVSEEVRDASGLVLQSREMLRESQRLIEAIQEHWLIRPYVKRGIPSTRIPAAAVGGPDPEER